MAVKQHIDNEAVKKLHRAVKEIKLSMYGFFGVAGRIDNHILINFSTTEDKYLIRIKFVVTRKKLVFVVDREDNTLVECQQSEKTDNVARDIHQLYINKVTTPLDLDGDLSAQISPLFFWGLQPRNLEGEEVYKANAVPASKIITADGDYDLRRLAENDLCYSVITDIIGFHEVYGSPDTVMLHANILDVKEPVYLMMTKEDLRKVCPGAIFIQNKFGNYNLYRFFTAKKHLSFSKDEFTKVIGLINDLRNSRQEAA